jgi:hypothetical protein
MLVAIILLVFIVVIAALVLEICGTLMFVWCTILGCVSLARRWIRVH